MLAYPAGIDLSLSNRLHLNFVYAAKALANLRICAGRQEHYLFDTAINTDTRARLDYVSKFQSLFKALSTC